MTGIKRGALLLGTSCLMHAPAFAQRSEENAVRQATDAFGTTIGNERVGIYTESEVRGFNPIAAGNARINGMYYDQRSALTPRLQSSSAIRVGLTAQSYPFPAPTGVVDYALRLPGSRPIVSVVGGYGPFGSRGIEVDAQIPVSGESLSVGAGLGVREDDFHTGASRRQLSAGLLARYRSGEDTEIVGFWGRFDVSDNEASPIIQLAGNALPSKIERRRFYGQQWTDFEYYDQNYGIVGRTEVARGWTLRAGAFRSESIRRSGFVDLFQNTRADGTARHVILADPLQRFASTSGEIRLTRAVPDGPRAHLIHLAARARTREGLFGGSSVIDLGVGTVGVPNFVPKPQFVFSEQSKDRIRQYTFGAAYEGRWPGVGEVSLGLQKTDYQKTIDRPSRPGVSTQDAPWLVNGTLALYVSKRLALYGGYTSGLEESGSAPDNAANRGEALPAIRTSQWDAGLRYILSPRFRVAAGVFDVKKPYFNLNQSNVFTLLGEQRHRGMEISASGQPLDNLTLVAGVVLMQPRVTGEAVDLGRAGPRPVGQAERIIRLNVDYAFQQIAGVSVDLGVGHSGSRAANVSNGLFLPPSTIVDAGLRYRFKIADNRATLRFLVSNVFNDFAWRVAGSGIIDYNEPRRATAQLALDF